MGITKPFTLEIPVAFLRYRERFNFPRTISNSRAACSRVQSATLHAHGNIGVTTGHRCVMLRRWRSSLGGPVVSAQGRCVCVHAATRAHGGAGTRIQIRDETHCRLPRAGKQPQSKQFARLIDFPWYPRFGVTWCMHAAAAPTDTGRQPCAHRANPIGNSRLIIREAAPGRL